MAHYPLEDIYRIWTPHRVQQFSPLLTPMQNSPQVSRILFWTLTLPVLQEAATSMGLHDSWVDFMHIDSNHGVNKQLDIAASNPSFAEDQDYLFSNENIGGEAHADELSIDLDGEFVMLLPFLATEYF